MKDILSGIEKFFIPPEKTPSGIEFGHLPISVSFNDANIVIYGIPLDITTTFGRGTVFGPTAIRKTSAEQIETFVFEEAVDISDKVSIYDLGDIRIPYITPGYENKNSETTINRNINDNKNKNDNNNEDKSMVDDPLNYSYSNHSPSNFDGNTNSENDNTQAIFDYLDSTIPKINHSLTDSKKIPIILGGEHTLSYFTVKSFSNLDPLVIHFDAHRDMKKEYMGMQMCHTTPFYYLLDEGWIKPESLVQIGIRQADKEENEFAVQKGIETITPWDINKDLTKTLNYINNKTKDRNVFLSIDIDVLDLPYVPCTGTPEPFGLSPWQLLEILKSISPSSNLVGMDLVEVGLRNEDYREGTIASQLLFRIFLREYIKVK